MKKLSVIVSSTRPTRINPRVAEWVAAQAHGWDATVVDISHLPFMDEEEMPRTGKYSLPHTLEWSKTITDSDAVLIVTPEYNNSFPAPIKNAIDMLYPEWEAKPIALVGYGWREAAEALAGLTKVLHHVQANVVGAVGLKFPDDLSVEGVVAPAEDKTAALDAVLADLASANGDEVAA